MSRVFWPSDDDFDGPSYDDDEEDDEFVMASIRPNGEVFIYGRGPSNGFTLAEAAGLAQAILVEADNLGLDVRAPGLLGESGRAGWTRLLQKLVE